MSSFLSKETDLIHAEDVGGFLGSSGGISGILIYLEFQRHTVVLLKYILKIFGTLPSKGGD